MINFQEHIIYQGEEARSALRILDKLKNSISRTLFIVNTSNKMVGSLTDGDIRRGLLNGLEISQPIEAFMNKGFKSIHEHENNVQVIRSLREADLKLIPLLNDFGQITQVLDLTKTRTILPAAALIMAGGRGERLKPFTDTVPKPMLNVGGKPIIEHNIDRLIAFGISEIYISVKYLKEQIMDYFGDGSAKGVRIKYLIEEEPLGTLGALALIDGIGYDDILVMNSDLLTNIDFEDFFQFYQTQGAEMAVASIPYHVNIPYAVLETDHHHVASFIEKPTYTYYSNGGIYLLKFKLKSSFEKDSFFNATDLMDNIISDDNTALVHYPLLCYWLDIGKHQDFIKAQDDIKHLNF
ncbi:Nucleotidyl transferase [Pedobacter steynii]|uniref:Nucleotidyl transferase n=1 Tax=Pedobacter steynii TaxID=430522 RepID=A0A1G9WG40_9SPHI|nr:nucleotidyltransferase family protein [Pedobacter steynii]NQX40283.1 NTP transferase domain-containing protein [Pedobacter steynii]SDM83277.1 Nucleotidyl transferase [Pedobacter steynii]